MENFLLQWHKSSLTSAGLFWMAFWAFGLGYLVSSLIQVLVTKERMRQHMGEDDTRSVSLATVFGFLSSSCSFAALATTRTLFAKGAGPVSSLAFLLASTNLVIELGIVIAVFLSWQFVVGEYVGGVLLILLMWLLVSLTLPKELLEKARENALEDIDEDEQEKDKQSWKDILFSKSGWFDIANKYTMEWGMVWKDVAVGFTVAGVIAVFVPKAFFQSLFLGSGSTDPVFYEVVIHSMVGPVAAFFTFIGSMGNVPLAAVLYGNGVSFAGVMAFLFSDLVVFPVLRIQARYYGWRMAIYILFVFFVILVVTSVLLHYGFFYFDAMPSIEGVKNVADRSFFQLDLSFVLNMLFLVMSVFFFAWKFRQSGFSREKLGVLGWLAMLSFGWLGVGLSLPLFTN